MNCSIIVTSYNYENFILEALNSVKNQTFNNYELIIVDDGSKDRSVELIEKWILENPKIKAQLLFHPDRANKHIVATYNLAMKSASGDTIAFLESDDYLHPASLERRIEAIKKHPSVGLVSSRGYTIGEDIQFQKSYLSHLDHILRDKMDQPISFKSEYREIPSRNFIPTFTAAMIKRSILNPIETWTSHNAWYDCWLWAQASQITDFYISNEQLFYWRVHPKSNNTQFVKGIDIESYTKQFESDLFKTTALNL